MALGVPIYVFILPNHAAIAQGYCGENQAHYPSSEALYLERNGPIAQLVAERESPRPKPPRHTGVTPRIARARLDALEAAVCAAPRCVICRSAAWRHRYADHAYTAAGGGLS